MPVTLTTQPPTINSLDECLKFGLTLSDGGTPPEIKSIGYRLVGNGIQLTEPEQIKFTGQEEFFEVPRELSKVVMTSIPALNSSAITEDNDIIKPYYLEYGEITLNTETCDTVVDISNISPIFNVIGARMDFFNYSDFPANTPVVLSNKPGRLPIASDQEDWIYIFGNGTTQVNYTVYDALGNVLLNGVDDRSLGNQVFIYPIGPANAFFGMPSGAAYYDILISDGTQKIHSIRFVINSSCDEESGYLELIFQEAIGGFGSIRLDSPKTSTQVSSGVFKERRKNCPTSRSELASHWYDTRFDIRSQKNWQLAGTMEFTTNIDWYIDSIFQGPQHYLKVRTRDGSIVLHKINLINGTYQSLNGFEDIQLNINFKSHQPLSF